jgi:hypothetical protein
MECIKSMFILFQILLNLYKKLKCLESGLSLHLEVRRKEKKFSSIILHLLIQEAFIELTQIHLKWKNGTHRNYHLIALILMISQLTG